MEDDEFEIPKDQVVPGAEHSDDGATLRQNLPRSLDLLRNQVAYQRDSGYRSDSMVSENSPGNFHVGEETVFTFDQPDMEVISDTEDEERPVSRPSSAPATQQGHIPSQDLQTCSLTANVSNARSLPMTIPAPVSEAARSISGAQFSADHDNSQFSPVSQHSSHLAQRGSWLSGTENWAAVFSPNLFSQGYFTPPREYQIPRPRRASASNPGISMSPPFSAARPRFSLDTTSEDRTLLPHAAAGHGGPGSISQYPGFMQNGLITFPRGRAYSAPSTLTIEQYFGRELGRIGDEFDRNHGRRSSTGNRGPNELEESWLNTMSSYLTGSQSANNFINQPGLRRTNQSRDEFIPEEEEYDELDH